MRRRIEQFQRGFKKGPDGKAGRREYSFLMEQAEKMVDDLKEARAALQACKEKPRQEYNNMNVEQIRAAFQEQRERLSDLSLSREEQGVVLNEAIRLFNGYDDLLEQMRPLELEVLKLEAKLRFYEELDASDEEMLRSYKEDELPQA